MHDNPGDDDNALPTDPPGPQAQATLSATDYLHLAEECLVLASLAKDSEKAELLKTSDGYLRRAAQLIADQLKNH
jgi:hypothetical protein